MDIPVLYDDPDFLVVNKPAGLVVAPTETQSVKTLADYLIEDFKINLDRGGIVHRLDKDTSGILVVAKTQQALENLQMQFKERMVKKQYLALVHGITPESGTVEGAIERNPRAREKFIVDEEGKEAKTDYKLEAKYQMTDESREEIFEGFNKIQKRKLDRNNYGEFSLLRCFPFTGRTHQIRVHLKHIGHSIVGDDKYGGRKTARLDNRWCPRQFLHAAKIEFYHPLDGRKIEVECELPTDLKDALAKLVLTK